MGCLLLTGAVWLAGASAAVEKQGGFIAFTEENDSFSDPFGPHFPRQPCEKLISCLAARFLDADAELSRQRGHIGSTDCAGEAQPGRLRPHEVRVGIRRSAAHAVVEVADMKDGPGPEPGPHLGEDAHQRQRVRAA